MLKQFNQYNSLCINCGTYFYISIYSAFFRATFAKTAQELEAEKVYKELLLTWQAGEVAL